MPQLDILIWFSLSITTSILFWSVYYIIIRWFILHYYLIFNVRVKLKNILFLLSFVLFNLVFKNNFLQLKSFFIYNNSLLKSIYMFVYFYLKCLNILSTLRILYIFNFILLRLKHGFLLHNFLYFTFSK